MESIECIYRLIPDRSNYKSVVTHGMSAPVLTINEKPKEGEYFVTADLNNRKLRNAIFKYKGLYTDADGIILCEDMCGDEVMSTKFMLDGCQKVVLLPSEFTKELADQQMEERFDDFEKVILDIIPEENHNPYLKIRIFKS